MEPTASGGGHGPDVSGSRSWRLNAAYPWAILRAGDEGGGLGDLSRRIGADLRRSGDERGAFGCSIGMDLGWDGVLRCLRAGTFRAVVSCQLIGKNFSGLVWRHSCCLGGCFVRFGWVLSFSFLLFFFHGSVRRRLEFSEFLTIQTAFLFLS